MTGIAKNTVAKLLVDVGRVCSIYQDENLRNLPCKRVQCDEIWAFVGAKAKERLTKRSKRVGVTFGRGRRIDADTKLVRVLLGRRTWRGMGKRLYAAIAQSAHWQAVRSPQTRTSHTSRPSKRRSEEIRLCDIDKATDTRRTIRATARLPASAATRRPLAAYPTRSTSLPALWSVRTSPCGCRCAALPG